jgi:hypothetical protein
MSIDLLPVAAFAGDVLYKSSGRQRHAAEIVEKKRSGQRRELRRRSLL